MKIAVIGSRVFDDYNKVKQTLDEFHKKTPITLIVSGGATGADKFGERWALENNIETKIFFPEWGQYGKSAGYRRNVDIINEAEIIIAFWDGESKGTAHSLNLARNQHKICIIVH